MPELNIQPYLVEGATRTLTNLGNKILEIYKARVPQKTGALANSIRFKVDQTGNTLTLGFYYLYYGIYVDLGTGDNFDPATYGISAYDLPAYGVRAKKGKGIAPSYWSSLSDKRAEFEGYLDTEMTKLAEKVADQISDKIQSDLKL